MDILLTGVVSGIVASAVFYIFLLLVRPKIHISDDISESHDDGKRIFRIKIVNKTCSMLTNVKYSLCYCKEISDGVFDSKEIVPIRPPINVISKYSGRDKYSEYAIRFIYEITPDIDISEGWLEFSIYAHHGFSNTCACVKKIYRAENIKIGVFETRTSMRIISQGILNAQNHK